MTAFDALEKLGITEFDPAYMAGRRTEVAQTTLSCGLQIALLTTWPRPFDFETPIKNWVVANALYDPCSEDKYTPEDKAAIEERVSQYRATTFVSMGTEWEYMAWDDETGFDGLLAYVSDYAASPILPFDPPGL